MRMRHASFPALSCLYPMDMRAILSTGIIGGGRYADDMVAAICSTPQSMVRRRPMAGTGARK